MDRKMQNNSMYSSLSRALCYIDKTKALEKELKVFPGIYLEGAAASGKTTAVKMLLSKRNDVAAEVFFMDKETTAPGQFRERLWEARNRMDKENVWIILENVPQELPQEMAEDIVCLFEELPEAGRVIMVGRQQPEERFLALLWGRKMELLSQKVLLFTEAEICELAEATGSRLRAEDVLRVSGGWAGCVDMILRFSAKSADNFKLSAEAIRDRYEIRYYLQREILDSLLDKEKELLLYASNCPWLQEKLCEEIFGFRDAQKYLEGLEKKGIFQVNRKERCYRVSPLFVRKNSDVSIKTQDRVLLFFRLGKWYEEHGYIKEALICLKKSGDRAEWKACMLRNYEKVSFLGISYEETLGWRDSSPQSIYLKAMWSFYEQDFQRFREEMRRAKEKPGQLAEEIYLNLAYADPAVSLEEWLSLLEEHTHRAGKTRLYHMLGYSCSFLCGIRDLSELFTGTKKEIKRKARIWNEGLGEKEQKAYEFAYTEYRLEIKDKAVMEEEYLKNILQKSEGEPDNTGLARMFLVVRLWWTAPQEKIEEYLEKRKETFEWDWDSPFLKNAEAVFYTHLLRCGERQGLVWWLEKLKNRIPIEVRGENGIAWWCRAKVYLYLNEYDKSEEILVKLISFFRTYRRIFFLAEALFMLAVVKWKQNQKNKALPLVIESFLITGDCRYVVFYLGYGKTGVEILEDYMKWMQRNMPEVWRQKKKYNYGSVLRMPFADYVNVICREAGNNRKAYPDLRKEASEERLTRMERIILSDISEGMTNNEISKALNLKLPTVKGHLYSLYKKLGVSSRVQAILVAKEQGILK